MPTIIRVIDQDFTICHVNLRTQHELISRRGAVVAVNSRPFSPMKARLALFLVQQQYPVTLSNPSWKELDSGLGYEMLTSPPIVELPQADSESRVVVMAFGPAGTASFAAPTSQFSLEEVNV